MKLHLDYVSESAKGQAFAAGQTVAALFAVPHSKKRKRYLEALEAGMDASSADKASSAVGFVLA